MDPQEVLRGTQDALTARRVFGDPIQVNGATVIPVAVVGGGGGGGTKNDKEGGVGFGLGARPAGVYVIKDGQARWTPAVNANLIIMGGQALGLAALFLLRGLFKRPTPKKDEPRAAA